MVTGQIMHRLVSVSEVQHTWLANASLSMCWKVLGHSEGQAVEAHLPSLWLGAYLNSSFMDLAEATKYGILCSHWEIWHWAQLPVKSSTKKKVVVMQAE